MKKKVLALLMVIPIVFTLILFTVGNIASVFVDIPVSGIHFTTQNTDGFIQVDMATYNNDLKLSAQVEPVNAKNKNYNFSIDYLENSNSADIEILENGILKAYGTGKAKITVTSSDNGFTDSLIVSVFSSKVLSIRPTITNAGLCPINIPENNSIFYADIESGLYNFGTIIYPKELSDKSIKWVSDNPDVLEINETTGKAKAKFSGKAKITAICNDGKNGKLSVNTIVNVRQKNTISGLTVDGQENPIILCANDATSASFFVEKNKDFSNEIDVSGYISSDIKSYEIERFSDDKNKFIITLYFDSRHSDTIKLDISLDDNKPNKVVLKFADYKLDIFTSYHLTSDDIINQKNNSTVSYIAENTPFNDDITYTWETDNSNIIKLVATNNGLTCKISTLSVGCAKIKVKAFLNGNQIGCDVIKTINSVKPVYSLEFVDNAKTYGIENLLTLGDTNLSDGRYSHCYNELKLRIQTDNGYEYYNGKDFSFYSSDVNKIKPFPTLYDFKINIVGDGIATIKAVWDYAQYFGQNAYAEITVRGVADGVNITSDKGLITATEDNKKIVLKNNIFLGKPNMSVNELKAYAKKIPTNYDWKFYENKGESRPDIYYLIEFTNDVYGNGYSINADNITKAEDSTGSPLLFKGPLDFVSIATASVKAQDNIVFLISTNGILLNNIILKGCSDESLINNAGFDLTELNYTGTTLEVMADCKILNSRISNGRTVVRIFGGKTTDGSPVINSVDNCDAKTERINADIENCIITNAREFILKIGSNRAVLAKGNSEDTFSPTKLTRADGTEYQPFSASNKTDSYFYDKYVITDVTLKDSILATSGLFSIGMETHFTGIMLSGYSSLNPTNWKGLASTSYASALHLEGDIKLLDWKKLENIDSSTLIETTNNARQFLTLDISAMIDKVYSSSHTEYQNIVSKINNEKYVHGGIAFYGGGYNYSYLDASKCTSEELTQYAINLSVLAEGLDADMDNPLYLQGTMLPLAAGYSDFVFYMYNNESENNYQKQLDILEKGNIFI